jgi:glycosyltransferase involved in cell wall biosynthesis
VVFHQPFSAAGVLKVAPKRIPKLYYFYSPAGVEYRLRARDPKSDRLPIGTGAIASILAWLEKRALQRVDRIIVLSDFSRRLLEGRGLALHATTTNPGGVDLEHFHPSSDRMEVRKRLGLPLDVPVLFSLRDLEQRMGIDRLLRAVTGLLRHRQLTCVIGGSGPLRLYLEQLTHELGVEDSVRFAGHIPEQELPSYYQAADLFVLPTVSHEGFGLVTVEALACGTPVVATPVGATPEILAPLDEKLLAQDATVDSIYRAIQQALDDHLGSDFRRRCRDYAESRYSWSRHAEALEEQILQLRKGTIPDGSRTDAPTHRIESNET